VRSTREATTARRARGEASRAKLVSAAIASIAERGYGATSVSDVCRRAGVAKTVLYWHFGSKEGLLAAVLESISGSWIENVRKRAYLEMEPVARVNRVVDDWRGLLKSHPQLVRLPLFLQLELANAPSEEIREALRRVIERAETALAEGIEDSFGIRGEERDLLARASFSLIAGAIQRTSIARDEAEVDRIFDDLRRTLVAVLASRLPA
jgi:AcrR family transcriptional regulator